MAQVTVSGKFGYSYIASQTNAGVKTSGFSATDGDVNFTAAEDLGNGLKATAFMGIRLRGREVNADAGSSTAHSDQADGIGARDSRITLSGGFGSVTVGAVASGSGILLGNGGAGYLQGLDHDSTLVDAEVNGIDLFQYQTPTIAGFNAYVQVVDSIGNPGAGGLNAADKTVAATVVGINYAAGPIKANIDTTSYDRNTVASGAVAETADSRVRASASYDMGVATVGLGYQTNDNTTTDIKQMLMGVSIPMGAISLGANYATRDTKTISTGATVKNKGYEVGANYAFSKRTNLVASYRVVNEGNKDIDQKSTRVRLMHAF
jgi:predicted porin